MITDDDDWRLVSPNGLLMDGPGKLLVVDYTTGNLFRIDLKAMLPMVGNVPVQAATKTLEKVMGGFGASDGLVRDSGGRLIVTDYAGHRVFVIAKPAAQPPEKPQEIPVSGIESAADLAISADGKSLLIPDMGGGKIATVPMPK